jgi:5-methylcytosine-specific restriction endonuclease McrA
LATAPTGLPLPDSDELRALSHINAEERAVYRVLFESRNESDDRLPTMQQIRDRVGGGLGDNEQLDRRRRNLNYHFVIEKVRRPRTDGRRGMETAYRLVAPKAKLTGLDAAISERDRAFVLRHGRCAMCGRTPLDDGVKLQVDHRVPREWGGDNSVDNLQPLCEECNRGKKNLFASLRPYAAAIKKAIGHEAPQVRAGEFLQAVYPEWVRSDILDMVVSPPHDFQEDWQRRVREIRDVGWDYEIKKRKEDRRMRSYYRLTKSAPWPPPRAMRAAFTKGRRSRPASG